MPKVVMTTINPLPTNDAHTCMHHGLSILIMREAIGIYMVDLTLYTPYRKQKPLYQSITPSVCIGLTLYRP